MTIERISIENYFFNGLGPIGEALTLNTDHGSIDGLYISDKKTDLAVVWAGSWTGEERISPIAKNTASLLLQNGIDSLILKYRKPRELPSSSIDTEAGIIFLESLGYSKIALVGHSFSGAVVITTGPLRESIVTVVALASQTYGARPARELSPKSLLLIHGTNDERLDVYCSEQIYSWAKQPKELLILEGSSHSLREDLETVVTKIENWISAMIKTA